MRALRYPLAKCQLPVGCTFFLRNRKKGRLSLSSGVLGALALAIHFLWAIQNFDFSTTKEWAPTPRLASFSVCPLTLCRSPRYPPAQCLSHSFEFLSAAWTPKGTAGWAGEQRCVLKQRYILLRHFPRTGRRELGKQRGGGGVGLI